jgi:hypothetical protein
MKTLIACGVIALASSTYGVLALIAPLLNSTRVDFPDQSSEN